MTHPTLSCDLGAVRNDLPRGCAYLTPDGAVYAVDPAGRAARTSAIDAEKTALSSEACTLLAVGLSAADCASLRKAWADEPTITASRRRQLALLREAGPSSARALAAGLRATRRRSPPPGSASWGGFNGIIVRLPTGSGWGCTFDLDPEENGWPWDAVPPLTLTVASGLDDSQCRRLIAAVVGSSDKVAARGTALALLRQWGLA